MLSDVSLSCLLRALVDAQTEKNLVLYQILNRKPSHLGSLEISSVLCYTNSENLDLMFELSENPPPNIWDCSISKYADAEENSAMSSVANAKGSGKRTLTRD